jgi:hypothetical protein
MSRSARQAAPLASVVAVTVITGALLTACGAASSPDPAQPVATVTVTPTSTGVASQPASPAPPGSPLPSASTAPPASPASPASPVSPASTLSPGSPGSVGPAGCLTGGEAGHGDHHQPPLAQDRPEQRKDHQVGGGRHQQASAQDRHQGPIPHLATPITGAASAPSTAEAAARLATGRRSSSRESRAGCARAGGPGRRVRRRSPGRRGSRDRRRPGRERGRTP